jgi:hypothetical protein
MLKEQKMLLVHFRKLIDISKSIKLNNSSLLITKRMKLSLKFLRRLKESKKNIRTIAALYSNLFRMNLISTFHKLSLLREDQIKTSTFTQRIRLSQSYRFINLLRIKTYRFVIVRKNIINTYNKYNRDQLNHFFVLWKKQKEKV